MNINRFVKSSTLVLALLSLFVLTGCSSSDKKEDSGFQYKTQLKAFNSCDELSSYLVETAELRQQLGAYYDAEVSVLGSPELSTTTDVTNDASSDGSGSAAPASESSNSIADFTSTNNQVAGVDEADFVKTDENGFTYIVTGGHFVVFSTWPAAESEELARVELQGNTADLFVYGDVAWVVSNVYDYKYDNELIAADSLVGFAPRVNQLTLVSIFDISQRRDSQLEPQLFEPQLIREITLEGYYVDARRIENRVHMVTSAYIDFYPLLESTAELDINDLLPALIDKLHSADGVVATTELISQCANIYRPGTANGTGTMSLLSFDLNEPQAEIKRQTIISNSGTVYANKQHLYLATMEDNYWAWLPVLEGDDVPKPGTTFHKFSLLKEPVYLASGRVDGYLINQFAMDEYSYPDPDNPDLMHDLLRTVTTVSAWWADGIPVNSLFILEQSGDQLVQRSVLTGLGEEGERIYAARFMGDKGFVVTFEQIDPLYTLDLSDPDNPHVAGELKVPGFSTYLHPLQDGLLLAIGREDNSIKLSLFDISDFAHPEELFSQLVGNGSYSEAEYNHKAFTWYAQEQLLALPVTQWNYDTFFADTYTISDVFNGLQLYKVDRDTGINKYGEVDHSDFYRDETDSYWYYPENIRRSFFVTGESQSSYLYSISSRGMKVNALPELETLVALPLPVYGWQDETLF